MRALEQQASISARTDATGVETRLECFRLPGILNGSDTAHVSLEWNVILESQSFILNIPAFILERELLRLDIPGRTLNRQKLPCEKE